MNLLQSLQKTAKETEELLEINKEWVERYAGYASDILANKRAIEEARKSFREWKPLYVYSSISKAKDKNLVTFDLRYRGQSVATIKHGKDTLKLVPKANIDKFYGIKAEKSFDWDSIDGKNFRKAFAKNPTRNNVGKKNEEHRFESALLTELSKTVGSEKILKNIQPVDLVDCRFQMPTPFNASKAGPVYVGHKGGGIDILCRVRPGNKVILNVFELKDEYEDPKNVLRQAVIYSVFIHKLLKTSDAGSNDWWKLFGFSKAPDPARPLEINAVAALPKNKKNDKSFEKKEIAINGGTIRLHYFYFFLSKTDDVGSIETSLFKKTNAP